MDVQTRAQFHLRTRVRFANGAFADAGREAAALGKTALVVTGRSAMRKAGLTDKLVDLLAAAGVRPVLFEEASPNPTTGEVDRGAELARREGVDVVVGLGGGSAMDVAKAIAMTVAYDKPCYEICAKPLDRPGLPVVAITTTSGTGAEVTGIAVVTEPSLRHKTAVRSLVVAPAVAIVDPELTVTMPPAVTASTGMDALAHAVESYFSKNANFFTELFAERATSLALAHLRAACANGTDLEARTGMAMANLTAGITLSQAGVILGHGVGMTLGGLFGTDHGATVGLLLPDVLEFCLPAIESKLARLSRVTGVAPGGQAAVNDSEAARAFIAEVRGLIAELPLPDGLRAMGCTADEMPLIVKGVLTQAATANNPIPVTETSAEEFVTKVLR